LHCQIINFVYSAEFPLSASHLHRVCPKATSAWFKTGFSKLKIKVKTTQSGTIAPLKRMPFGINQRDYFSHTEENKS